MAIHWLNQMRFWAFWPKAPLGLLHRGSNAPKHMNGCFSNNTVTNPLSRWRGSFSIIKKCPPNAWRNIKECHVHGAHALNVMEHNLAKHGFFGGDDPNIADIALFAYTHVADQGGFELQNYPAITRWIDDMKSIPGYTPITERID